MVEDHKRKFHAHIKRNRDGEEKNANQNQCEELIIENKINGETKKELQALKVEYKLWDINQLVVNIASCHHVTFKSFLAL